jgi:hypothetical protein
MVDHATADSPRPDLVVVHRAPDQPATPGIAGDSVNAARFLAIDAVEKADSGHPGTPMGLAPLMYRLYTRHLRHDPADPTGSRRAQRLPRPRTGSRRSPTLPRRPALPLFSTSRCPIADSGCSARPASSPRRPRVADRRRRPTRP